MSTYISVEVKSYDIVEAMENNATFAEEMWRSILDGLTSGLLFDECVDLMANLDVDEREETVAVLRRLADSIEQGRDPE